MRALNTDPAASSSDDLTVASRRAARGNRRRLLVFASVFLTSLVIGMAWNLLRAPVYRALTLVQITLPSSGAVAQSASSAWPGSDIGPDFTAQLQRLRSRPVLEQVHQRLQAAGLTPAVARGDAVVPLQSMIEVHAVPGSAVVELSATGAPPLLLATALNELVAVYREQLLTSHSDDEDRRIDQTRAELTRLEQAARDRQLQLERFRDSGGLLSTERDENESVSRAQGLSAALNSAMEKQATAEGRLRAIQAAVAAGHGAAAARDDPTLANLEQRASQLREELRDVGRTYTEEFMARDVRVRSLRSRLSELESQIVTQRAVSQQQALAKAQEDVATAQANVVQLQGQSAAARQGMRSFSTRFAQAKVMEDDLASVERARRETIERLARLEASQQGRRPAVDVLQPATASDTPWRPDYGRDAGLVLAGSLALGLLAMGLVELFNRPPAIAGAAPVTVILPASWPALAGDASLGAWPKAAPALVMGANASSALTALSAPSDPLEPSAPSSAAVASAMAISGPSRRRELTQAEAAALLAAARGPARLACAAWLLGLTTPELAALKSGDVDRTARRLRVGGAWGREVTLPGWFVDALPAPPVQTDGPADAPLLHDADGRALDEPDLQMLLLCAAVDAGLPDSASLTPDRLRHTAMAWLVRQGLPFAHLPTRFGRVDAPTLTELAALAGDGPRHQGDDIDALMPALRLSPTG